MEYRVSLEKLIRDLKLEVLAMPGDPAEHFVTTPNVNRPGLQLAGFYEGFETERLQMIGTAEMDYLQSFDLEQQEKTIDRYFCQDMPAVVLCKGVEAPEYMIKAAQRRNVPLLKSDQQTSALIASAMSILSVELAPRMTRHGVLVEVYGEGILIMGESGVGKSETAIELIKRGHRLVADDAVELRRVSDRTLVGQSPDNIRHFMELRGVGIINARRVFGMGSVKVSEKVELVIKLENWDSQKVYDRMGLEDEYVELLGLNIPCLTIPVKPGRNLAIIIEVAAMNSRQKKLGYNAAQELLQNLGMVE